LSDRIGQGAQDLAWPAYAIADAWADDEPDNISTVVTPEGRAQRSMRMKKVRFLAVMPLALTVATQSFCAEIAGKVADTHGQSVR
jgi:hypothetical protein